MTQFYDFPTYPWHFPEANALHIVLYESIQNPGEIDLIRRTCGKHVKPVAQGPAHHMWRDVLDAVAVGGCLKQLELHLRTLGMPKIVETLDQLLDAIDDALEPGMGELIFVNRSYLRAALRRLAAVSTSKQVLVVRGESQSGKSWTRQIVQHYANTLGHGCTYLYEGMVTNAEEVLSYIFAELGGEVPARDTSDEAWFRKACTHMLRLAGNRNRGTWIIMDDLGVTEDGAPLLDQQIRLLFDQVARNMLNPAFAKWFRVVLIDYPEGPLPKTWNACALEDRTTVNDIHTVVLIEFLMSWARRHNKVLAETDADWIAQNIMTKAADADGRLLLKRVHDELDSALSSL